MWLLNASPASAELATSSACTPLAFASARTLTQPSAGS
jgi:hypothetical protein